MFSVLFDLQIRDYKGIYIFCKGLMLPVYLFPGLAFDEWDLDYYTNLFKEKIKRNPTSVECFDLAQSNR